jgi:hypothetical protein
MFNEALILLMMMLAVMLKANCFSVFYLIFIFKYIRTQNKLFLIVDIVKYSTLFAFVQYLVILVNINDASAA